MASVSELKGTKCKLLSHKFQFGHFKVHGELPFRLMKQSRKKKMEWEMGKDTQKMNNIMRAEVRKCIEFSLPQAQVFYISSRNKFILVKTTNLSLSPFMPSCTPISSATIIPISSWSGLTTKTTTPGPNFHMATRHVEEGSEPRWRAFWRLLR